LNWLLANRAKVDDTGTFPDVVVSRKASWGDYLIETIGKNSMKARTWRRIHRYLGLVIGVQLLLWTTSGLIFSWNSIKAVRGEHLIREQSPIDLKNYELISIGDATEKVTEDQVVLSVELRTMLGRPVYELTLEENDTHVFTLVDARSGKVLSPIDADAATRVAQNDFAENVEVRSVELIESVGSHSEYRGKELPAFRVVMEHPTDTAIYVSANRGVVTTRRSNQWRLFDFFWMLHTMDYQGRDNFNTWLLKTVSIFGLVTVLSGFVLWFKTSRWFRRKKPRDSS